MFIHPVQDCASWHLIASLPACFTRSFSVSRERKWRLQQHCHRHYSSDFHNISSRLRTLDAVCADIICQFHLPLWCGCNTQWMPRDSISAKQQPQEDSMSNQNPSSSLLFFSSSSLLVEQPSLYLLHGPNTHLNAFATVRKALVRRLAVVANEPGKSKHILFLFSLLISCSFTVFSYA